MFTGRERVFLSHDGAIDEFVAMALLAMDPSIDLVGVSVVNGDCLPESAMRVQTKLLRLLGRGDVPVSLSNARAFNSFPMEYRADSVKLDSLSCLAGLEANPGWPPYPNGEDHLRSELEQSELTLLVTGPLTPIVDILRADPDLSSRIRRLVWMGGAIDVPGNLDPATLAPSQSNPCAEWNAYFDPFAVDWIFRRTGFPLDIVPLDCTNQAPLSEVFLDGLSEQAAESAVSRFASEAYRLVQGQPLYCLWDVAASAYLLRPDLFDDPLEMELTCCVWGEGQGCLKRHAGGRSAKVVTSIRSVGTFHDFVLAGLRS